MQAKKFNPLALALLGFLVGCGGSGGDGVVVGGEFPIAYVDRSAAAVGEAADGVVFVPGGDLYLRPVSSPSASPVNITGRYTRGRGDVSGPEASYDGRRLVFSMRGPGDPTWNIWEYDRDGGQLRRVIADDAIANAGDDMDPHYLPDGRIVFSSNRQATTREQLTQRDIEPFRYRDGYGREPALVLHAMNADGTGIEQLSFNQSHDRNPTVRMNGELMYARREHMGNRNQQPIFTMRPDGREVSVLYGAFSPGDSFLHPREMPDGRVISTLVPLAGARSGGALVIADVANYSDHARRLDGSEGQGQYQPTLYELPLGRQTSPHGRYTTPYPLWDGSNRVLVAWSPQQSEGPTSPVLPGEASPRYGIYALNLDDRSMRPIALARPGRVLTDPVALMPRPVPEAIGRASDRLNLAASVAPRPYEGEPDPCVDASGRPYTNPPDECEPTDPGDPTDPTNPGDPGDPTDPTDPGPGEPPPDPEPEPELAILNIRSVYDTDFLDSMGDSVLAGGETIPRTADRRPDLALLRDASRSRAEDRPARFLRVSQAVPLPPGLGLDAVGATSFGMQRLVGYAPIEPDGSVRVAVPADVPLTLAVVDAQGRAFQTHTSWLQARPDEERTCNGCHSGHREQTPLNTGSPAGGPFEGSVASLSAQPGETMAETRTRIDPTALTLRPHMVYRDVWTDPAAAGRAPDADRTIDYSGLPAGTAPTGGQIDYVANIQPIWDRNCVSCHSAGSALDLTGDLAATGRARSYDNLVLGQPQTDQNTGRIRAVSRDGRTVLLRERPLVDVGGSANSSRTSHLMERLYERELLAPQSRPASGVDHRGMLNGSELRVVAEWIDLGATYRNSPWTATANADGMRGLDELVTNAGTLDQAVFEQQVHPMLMRRCAGCHLPVAMSGDIADFNHRNPEYAPNRFALTGNAAADLGAATAMVTDACNATASPLLRRPASDEDDALAHPTESRIIGDGQRQNLPLLVPGDTDYDTLFDWISYGCR